jgi:hypothetical protein
LVDLVHCDDFAGHFAAVVDVVVAQPVVVGLDADLPSRSAGFAFLGIHSLRRRADPEQGAQLQEAIAKMPGYPAGDAIKRWVSEQHEPTVDVVAQYLLRLDGWRSLHEMYQDIFAPTSTPPRCRSIQGQLAPLTARTGEAGASNEIARPLGFPGSAQAMETCTIPGRSPDSLGTLTAAPCPRRILVSAPWC